MEINEVNEINEANEANNQKAQELLDGGIFDAQQVIQDPSMMDEVLARLDDKLNQYPVIREKLPSIPLMIGLLKAWGKKEYTEVSPKVIARLVSAIRYLVRENDLLWDNIPKAVIADDMAVLTLALRVSRADLKAFSEWQDEHKGTQA